MSILKDLYYGKVRYDEKPIAADSEHERLSREVVDMESRFRKELSDEAKRQYDLYTQKIDRISDIVALESFKHGFQLGVLLMLEAIETGGE